MRIARVIGTLTITTRLPSLRQGQYLIADALDSPALPHAFPPPPESPDSPKSSRSPQAESFRAGSIRPATSPAPIPFRQIPMPESLVVFDQLGAAPGQIIAVSEGREAAMPFHPDKVPIDAYCAAILDAIDMTP